MRFSEWMDHYQEEEDEELYDGYDEDEDYDYQSESDNYRTEYEYGESEEGPHPPQESMVVVPRVSPTEDELDRVSFARSVAKFENLKSRSPQFRVHQVMPAERLPTPKYLTTVFGELFVPELKRMLQFLKLRTYGNKPALIELLAEEVSRIYQEEDRVEVRRKVAALEGIAQAKSWLFVGRLPNLSQQSAQDAALAACAHLQLKPILAEPWVLLGPLSPPILLDELAADPDNLLPLHLPLAAHPSAEARRHGIPEANLSFVVAFFRVRSGPDDRECLQRVLKQRREQQGQSSDTTLDPIPAGLQFRSSPEGRFLVHLDGYVWTSEPIPSQLHPRYALAPSRYPRPAPKVLSLHAKGLLAPTPPGHNQATSLCAGHAVQVFEVYRDPLLWLSVKLAQMPVRPAAQVIEGWLERAKLDECAALRVTIPLRCPITMMRLIKPVRSTRCRHVQCFDLKSLQLTQAQTTPQTISHCPVCQVGVSEANLFIDGLVQEVIAQVDPAIDEVVVDLETGKWFVPQRKEGQEVEKRPARQASPVKQKKPNPHPPPPHQDLIDLTGVDDEEAGNPIWDEPVPIKEEKEQTILLSSSDDDGRTGRPAGTSIYAAIVID